MRNTLSAWRSVSTSPMKTVHSSPSSAAAVAVATPCWPAPVSAIRRRLPIRTASSPWPTTLLSLCEPVCSEVLALEQDPDAELAGEPRALGHRGGAAAELGEHRVAARGGTPRRPTRARRPPRARCRRARAPRARSGPRTRRTGRESRGRPSGSSATPVEGSFVNPLVTLLVRPRASSMKSATSTGSFTPGELSTPVATSTPHTGSPHHGHHPIRGESAGREDRRGEQVLAQHVPVVPPTTAGLRSVEQQVVEVGRVEHVESFRVHGLPRMTTPTRSST